MFRPTVSSPQTLEATCWAGQPVTAGPVIEMGVTEDGMLWHDHSPKGGDIVCTGPFGLFHEPADAESKPPLNTIERAKWLLEGNGTEIAPGIFVDDATLAALATPDRTEGPQDV